MIPLGALTDLLHRLLAGLNTKAEPRSDQRGSKPPPVALEVSRLVFASTVGLVDRRMIESGARSPGLLVVFVDVIDVHDKAAAGGGLGARRNQTAFACDAVQPDDLAANVDLTMDDPTLIVAIDPTGPQAKRPDQEVVASFDVLVNEQWDDSL